MRGFWRHAALPVGIVLVVLGTGNWLVSRSKLMEYTERQQPNEDFAERDSRWRFKRLTPRTNLTVLDRLHPSQDGYDAIDAKRDFYAVVYRGGGIIALAGVLLASVGTLQHWRDRRTRRARPEPNAGIS